MIDLIYLIYYYIKYHFFYWFHIQTIRIDYNILQCIIIYYLNDYKLKIFKFDLK